MLVIKEASGFGVQPRTVSAKSNVCFAGGIICQGGPFACYFLSLAGYAVVRRTLRILAHHDQDNNDRRPRPGHRPRPAVPVRHPIAIPVGWPFAFVPSMLGRCR